MIYLLLSAIFYLFIFLLTIGFAYIAERSYPKADSNSYQAISTSRRSVSSAKVIQRRVAIILAILIPCIVAAIRDTTVGVDTSGYPISHMQIASQLSSVSQIVERLSLGSEYLYAIILFLCSRVTSDYWLILFVYQLLTIVPIMATAIKIRNRAPMSVTMAIYMLVFFNNSLNMMRQSVSCAFILYGIITILEDNKITKKAVISLLVAVFFHKSGIIGLISIAGVLFASKIGKKVLKYATYILIVLLPSLATGLYEYLLAATPLRDNVSFLGYGDMFLYRRLDYGWDLFINPYNIYSMTFVIIQVFMMLVPLLYSRKTDTKSDVLFQSLRTINVCGLLTYLSILFGMKTMYGIRFSLFFDFFYVVSLSNATGLGKNRKAKKVFLVLILIAFWFLWVVINDWSGSAAYKTRF